MIGRRPFTPEEDRFLCAHYAQHGAAWCARQIGRAIPSVQYRVKKLELDGDLTFSEQQHSTLYSTEQLDALDAIGALYCNRQLSWDAACELRDWVKADRIDKAMQALVLREKEAA